MILKNYGGLPDEFCIYEKSKIVVLPVPYDGTSTWIKGADKGPDAILEASANMELYDIETDSEVYLRGIFTDNPVLAADSPENMLEETYLRTKSHLEKDKFIVTLGGEHSITFAPVKAHFEKYKDLSVLQLDAHTDLRDSYEGSKFNHACVMSRVAELCPIVQVGIRSMDVTEKISLPPGRTFFAENIMDNETWMQKAVDLLTPDVYLTIDLDVFDVSVMSSTGTPEPGGMHWYQVLKFIRKVADQRNITGFDVVELCPDSSNRSPDFLASKLIYKLLSYIFEKK